MGETLLIDYIEKMSEKLMNFNGNLSLSFIGMPKKMMPELELLMLLLIIIMSILEMVPDWWLHH